MNTVEMSTDVWITDIPVTTSEIDMKGKVQPVNVLFSDYASHIKLVQSTYPNEGTTKYQVRFDGYQTYDMTKENFDALKALINGSINPPSP